MERYQIVCQPNHHYIGKKKTLLSNDSHCSFRYRFIRQGRSVPHRQILMLEWVIFSWNLSQVWLILREMHAAGTPIGWIKQEHWGSYQLGTMSRVLQPFQRMNNLILLKQDNKRKRGSLPENNVMCRNLKLCSFPDTWPTLKTTQHNHQLTARTATFFIYDKCIA